MRKSQHKTGKEVFVDLVNPANGKVIPTLDWVAEYLLKKGWKKVSDEETTKKEISNGKKENR